MGTLLKWILIIILTGLVPPLGIVMWILELRK